MKVESICNPRIPQGLSESGRRVLLLPDAGKLSAIGTLGKRSPKQAGRFNLDDVSQIRVPKLERICFFFLIGMEVVNFVKPWSGVCDKQLTHDVLHGKRGKPRFGQVRRIMGSNSLPKPFSEIERHRPDDAPSKVRQPGCFEEISFFPRRTDQKVARVARNPTLWNGQLGRLGQLFSRSGEWMI